MYGFVALALAWQFIAPDAQQIVVMEWKRVLESPLSAAIRREIPSEATPALAGINFIEGIERVVWTPELLALEGNFDLQRLKDMATADGGAVTTYNKVELLGSPDENGTRVALVGTSLLLLGSEDTLRRSIDRSGRTNGSGPSGYDLWVRTSGPDLIRSEFGIRLAENVDVTARLRFRSEDAARATAEGAPTFGLTGWHEGVEARLSGRISREEFKKRQWRSRIESIDPVPPQASKPGVIRIYGLDEGVKEIPLN
jgi:hypothetical protein